MLEMSQINLDQSSINIDKLLFPPHRLKKKWDRK